MEARRLELLTFRVWGERSSRLSYASLEPIIAPFVQNASKILYILPTDAGRMPPARNSSVLLNRYMQNPYKIACGDGIYERATCGFFQDMV